MGDLPPLTQLVAEIRDHAAVLEHTGNTGQAQYLAHVAERLKDAAEDYTTWISEQNALLRSGWTERTMRRRFAELQECGLARWHDGKREFLVCAVPPRADIEGARERARMVTR